MQQLPYLNQIELKKRELIEDHNKHIYRLPSKTLS